MKEQPQEEPKLTTEERRARIMAAWPGIADIVRQLPAPEDVTEPCSRCGGSGHYSYNMMHGSVCFKCRGSKVQLIAKKARKHRELFKPERELQDVRAAGDVFLWNTMPYVAFQVVWTTDGLTRVRVRAMNLATWRSTKRYIHIGVERSMPTERGSRTAFGTLPGTPEDWRSKPIQQYQLDQLVEQAVFPPDEEGSTRLSWNIER